MIDQEVAAFQDLGNGAPADVKPTIDDIVTSLQAAESALADPAHPDLAKLQAARHEGAGRRDEADHLRRQQLQVIG